jgi:hypothetical protein
MRESLEMVTEDDEEMAMNQLSLETPACQYMSLGAQELN